MDLRKDSRSFARTLVGGILEEKSTGDKPLGKQKEDRDTVKQKKVFVRMTKNEFEQIKQNAELFGQGNVSRWIRERALDVSIKADEVKSKK